MNEKQLEKKLTEKAKTLGIHSIKLASANNRGQPDRMFLFGGKTMFMELKGEGKSNTLTSLQLRYIETLRFQGFVAEAVDDYEVGEALLLQLVSKSPTGNQLLCLKALNIAIDNDMENAITNISKAIKKSVPSVSKVMGECRDKGWLSHNGQRGVLSKWVITELGKIILKTNERSSKV